jgi:hypothetical protein
MTLTRRTLLGSLFCAAAAPAIVRISSIMPVKPMWIPGVELPSFAGTDPFLTIGRVDWKTWHVARVLNENWLISCPDGPMYQIIPPARITPAPV